MKIIKKQTHSMAAKCEAISQITFDEDMNVPDVKPDVGRMIQKKGEVQIDEMQITEGRVFIKGILAVHLLYVGDSQERRIHSLTGSIPIEESLNLEGLENGDKVRLKWEIEDLSLSLINSRKLNVKTLLTFQAVVDDPVDLQLPIGLEEESISQKKQNVNIMSLIIHKKDTLRLKEEITLASNKPNIYEILWHTIEVRGMDIRCTADHILVKGELFIFVLYSGNDENNSLQWLEYSIPFSQEVDCAGCTMEMIPNIELSMQQGDLKIKLDADGEERMLGVEVVLELDIKVYDEEEISLLRDVYTPSKEYIPHCSTRILESLLVKNFSKCKVNDRVKVEEEQGKILQICHSEGVVKVDDSQIVENGIQVEGIVQIRILYIVSDDEMPFYSMNAMIPFSHLIEAPDIDEDCQYHLRTDLEQLSTTMIDSDEIEVKIVMNLNALVVRQQSMEIMDDIEEQELDPEKINQMPGIIGYMVQPEDTLWDIAKSFYTTIDTIKTLNNLETEEIRPYDTLILMKKIEG